MYWNPWLVINCCDFIACQCQKLSINKNFFCFVKHLFIPYPNQMNHSNVSLSSLNDLEIKQRPQTFIFEHQLALLKQMKHCCKLLLCPTPLALEVAFTCLITIEWWVLVKMTWFYTWRHFLLIYHLFFLTQTCGKFLMAFRFPHAFQMYQI